MNNTLRWLRILVILVPPLLLFVLEWRHPVPEFSETPWQTIADSDGWWLQLHLMQLFLFWALGLSVICLVTPSMRMASALPLLFSISLFLAFYSVLDAITGIASGLVVAYTAVLSTPIQLAGNSIIDIFLANPVIGGGTFSVTGILGGGGWLAAMLFLARLITTQYRVHPVVAILFGASGILFGLSHLPPIGPLGMLCYLIACGMTIASQEKTTPQIANPEK